MYSGGVDNKEWDADDADLKDRRGYNLEIICLNPFDPSYPRPILL
jgi:hypothetical protein